MTTFDESTGLLREAALATGGAVVILDAPRYIHLIYYYVQYNTNTNVRTLNQCDISGLGRAPARGSALAVRSYTASHIYTLVYGYGESLLYESILERILLLYLMDSCIAYV